MAMQVKHKPKVEQNPLEKTRKRDALALARLIYDIWREEHNNGSTK